MYHLLTGGILRIWITRTQTGHMCCSPLCKVTMISATFSNNHNFLSGEAMGGISLKNKVFIKTSTIPSLLVISPSNCSPGSIILQFLNHHLPAAPHLLLYQAPPNLRLQCILEALGGPLEVYQPSTWAWPFHLPHSPKHGEWEHLGKCQEFFVERKTQLVFGMPWGFRNFTSSVRFLRMSCTKTSRKALTLPLFRPTNHENVFFVPITFQKGQMPIFPVQQLRKRFETCITTKWINPFTKRVKSPQLRVKISDHQPLDMTLAFKSLNCAEEPTCCAEPFGDRGHWEMGRGELMGISFTLPSLHQGLKVEVSFSILSKHVTRDEDSQFLV